MVRLQQYSSPPCSSTRHQIVWGQCYQLSGTKLILDCTVLIKFGQSTTMSPTRPHPAFIRRLTTDLLPLMLPWSSTTVDSPCTSSKASVNLSSTAAQHSLATLFFVQLIPRPMIHPLLRQVVFDMWYHPPSFFFLPFSFAAIFQHSPLRSEHREHGANGSLYRKKCPYSASVMIGHASPVERLNPRGGQA